MLSTPLSLKAPVQQRFSSLDSRLPPAKQLDSVVGSFLQALAPSVANWVHTGGMDPQQLLVSLFPLIQQWLSTSDKAPLSAPQADRKLTQDVLISCKHSLGLPLSTSQQHYQDSDKIIGVGTCMDGVGLSVAASRVQAGMGIASTAAALGKSAAVWTTAYAGSVLLQDYGVPAIIDCIGKQLHTRPDLFPMPQVLLGVLKTGLLLASPRLYTGSDPHQPQIIVSLIGMSGPETWSYTGIDHTVIQGSELRTGRSTHAQGVVTRRHQKGQLTESLFTGQTTVRAQTTNVTAPLYQLVGTTIRPFEGKTGAYDVSLTLTYQHSGKAEPQLVRKIGEAYVSEDRHLLKQLGPDLITYAQEITIGTTRSLPLVSTPRLQHAIALPEPVTSPSSLLTIAALSTATWINPLGGLLMTAALQVPTVFGEEVAVTHQGDVHSNSAPIAKSPTHEGLRHAFQTFPAVHPMSDQLHPTLEVVTRIGKYPSVLHLSFLDITSIAEPFLNSAQLSKFILLSYSNTIPEALDYAMQVDCRIFNSNAVLKATGETLLTMMVERNDLRGLERLLQHPDIFVYVPNAKDKLPLEIAIEKGHEEAALRLIRKEKPLRYLAKTLLKQAQEKGMTTVAQALDAVASSLPLQFLPKGMPLTKPQEEAVKYIVRNRDSETFNPDHRFQTSLGKLPLLHYFDSDPNPHAVSWLKELLDLGANPNIHSLLQPQSLFAPSLSSQAALEELVRHPRIVFEHSQNRWPHGAAIHSNKLENLILLRRRFGSNLEQSPDSVFSVVDYVSSLLSNEPTEEKRIPLLHMLEYIADWKVPLSGDSGSNPFACLCMHGYTKAIEKFIGILNSANPQGLSIPNLIVGFALAVENKKLESAEVILNRTSLSITEFIEFEKRNSSASPTFSVMSALCQFGNAKLLTTGFQNLTPDDTLNILNTYTYQNRTLLTLALQAENIETATWLLESGEKIQPQDWAYYVYHLRSRLPEISHLMNDQSRWTEETKFKRLIIMSLVIAAPIVTVAGLTACVGTIVKSRRNKARLEAQTQLQAKQDEKIQAIKTKLVSLIPHPFKPKPDQIILNKEKQQLEMTIALPYQLNGVILLPHDKRALLQGVFDAFSPGFLYEYSPEPRQDIVITIPFSVLFELPLPENAIALPMPLFTNSDSIKQHQFLAAKESLHEFSIQLRTQIRSFYISDDFTEAYRDRAETLGLASHPRFQATLARYQTKLLSYTDTLQSKLSDLGELQSKFNDIDYLRSDEPDELEDLKQTKQKCVTLIADIKRLHITLKECENDVENTLNRPKKAWNSSLSGASATTAWGAQSIASSGASVSTVNGAFKKAGDKAQFLSVSWQSLQKALLHRESEVDDSEARERVDYTQLISLIGPKWFEAIKLQRVRDRSEFGMEIEADFKTVSERTQHTQSFALCANTSRSVRKRGGNMTDREQIVDQLTTALQGYMDFALEKGIPQSSLTPLANLTDPRFIDWLTSFILSGIGQLQAPRGGSSHSRLEVPALVPGFGYSIESDILHSYFRLLALLSVFNARQ